MAESFVIDTPDICTIVDKETQISLCNQYIRDHLHLKHGDSVQLGHQEYRIESDMIWSMTKGLLRPTFRSSSVSEFPIISSEFRVGNEEGEFPPWYWREVFNYYYGSISLSESLREKVYSTLKKVDYEHLPDSIKDVLLHVDPTKKTDLFYTTIMIHKEPITIVSSSLHPNYFITVDTTILEGIE